MKKTKVLLGDVSSYKAIAVARFLRQHYPALELYGFDSKGFTKKIYSRYFRKNFVCDPDNIEEVITILDREGIDLFLPVINKNLAKYWAEKERFVGRLNYLGEFSDYEILNDKIQLHKLAETLGVRVPKRYENLEEAEFPYVVKPTNLSSAEGVVYIRSEEDLKTLELPDPCMIQEYVEGEGLGYSFYAKEGEIQDGYGHRRLAEYPVSGGSSTYRTGVADPRMHEMAQAIVSKLAYTGFAMFEFKRSKDGRLYLLEVNPRIWGSVNQGLSNGTNYFEALFPDLKPQEKKKTKEVHTYLAPHIYMTLAMYALKGNLKPLGLYLKNLGHNGADVPLFKDPMGYVSTLLRKVL